MIEIDDYQTLGSITEVLAAAIADGNDCSVKFGFDPASAHSWRGVYSELAFEPSADVLLSEMLAGLRAAAGQTFEGYKGGDYVMGDHVEVHIAHYGTGGGDQIGPTLLRYWLSGR